MLQSLWLRLRRSRCLLPARDLFDADLDRACRKPGCALCRLIQEHNQHSMLRILAWDCIPNRSVRYACTVPTYAFAWSAGTL
jgi:hypothetical protein